ncbi:PAS domain S-box protein [Novipirellula sp. SH528]|uniref:PAS domain S-box protein n=1 Tax=Novipirellula sp. SH528 TaxID=3454466 RepID=UPI003F9F03EA
MTLAAGRSVFSSILQSRAMTRYLPLLLLVGGVLGSTYLHHVMRSLDERAIEKGFRRASNERVAVFESELARPIDLIRSVKSLYISSHSVNPGEFRRFINEVNPKRVGFDEITWVRHIDDSEREEYESGDWVIPMGIVQRDSDAQLQPAPRRDDYLPVTYKCPANYSGMEIGEDLSEDPRLRESFAIALASNRITASPALPSGDDRPGVSIFLVCPIFQKRVDTANPDPTDALRGYIVGRLRLDRVLENALEPLTPAGISIELSENTATPDQRPTYYHPARLVEHETDGRALQEILGRDAAALLDYHGVVQRDGRTWTLHFTANADYIAIRRDSTFNTMLFLGIVTSAMLSVLVAFLFRRTEVVERLVKGRTADLNEAKRNAEEQLAKQVALEKELDVSREQFNVLMLGCNDGILEWDLETNKVFFSPRFLEMLGYDRDDIGDDADAALQLVHPDERNDVATKLDQYIQGELEKFEVECRILHKDNHFVHVLSRCFTVCRDGDSRPNRLVGSHVDLTQWKQHENELNQFKTTLDQTHDSVFMLNPETLNFYYVNLGATQLLGYSAEELCQMGPMDVDVDMSEAELQRMIASLKSGEKTMQRGETVVRRKDGRDVPVDLFVQYIAPDDEPPRFVTIVRDISERKQNEEILAERNRLAMLAADVGGSLSRADDMHTGLQECCQAMVDRLEVASARIWTVKSCENTLELKASAGLEKHLDALQSQIPVGESCVGHIAERGVVYLTNDWQDDLEVDDPRWAFSEPVVSFAGYPLIVGNNVIGVLALFGHQPQQATTLETLASISDTIAVFVERKRAEDALQLSHRQISKLSLVASKTQHAVFIMDAKCRIEWVNEAFTQMSEYAAADAVGRRPGDFLIGRDTDPETTRTIRQKISDRESIAVEIYNYKKSGEGHWIDLKIDPVFDEAGELCNFIATQIDISQRRENQQALVAAKVEAERASSAKSEFLASMSHELRTPLNGVIGMTELLADSPLDDRQRRFVSACQSSGKVLLELISDVLDFSKIEAGRMELDHHPFDLRQLFDDVLQSMPLRLEDRDIKLNSSLDPQAMVQVTGDSHRLRQVLVNLLSNAIKFTEHGEINLKAEPQERTDDSVTLLFSISDTGIGIPADRVDRLFHSFSQVDSSVSRKYGGSGLGLSISKAIVEKMGGKIGVESREGVGSRFWFTAKFGLSVDAIPSPKDIGPLPKQAKSSDLKMLDTRILLAEDNKINQLFTREMLLRFGWKCDVVENGVEVLEALQKKTYDIVLMDCQMPIMDGFVTTKRIRKRESEKRMDSHLVIVALTANAIQGDRERCLDAGMDEYLAKPFDPTQLRATIEACFAEVARRSACEHAAK